MKSTIAVLWLAMVQYRIILSDVKETNGTAFETLVCNDGSATLNFHCGNSDTSEPLQNFSASNTDILSGVKSTLKEPFLKVKQNNTDDKFESLNYCGCWIKNMTADNQRQYSPRGLVMMLNMTYSDVNVDGVLMLRTCKDWLSHNDIPEVDVGCVANTSRCHVQRVDKNHFYISGAVPIEVAVSVAFPWWFLASLRCSNGDVSCVVRPLNNSSQRQILRCPADDNVTLTVESSHSASGSNGSHVLSETTMTETTDSGRATDTYHNTGENDTVTTTFNSNFTAGATQIPSRGEIHADFVPPVLPDLVSPLYSILAMTLGLLLGAVPVVIIVAVLRRRMYWGKVQDLYNFETRTDSVAFL